MKSRPRTRRCFTPGQLLAVVVAGLVWVGCNEFTQPAESPTPSPTTATADSPAPLGKTSSRVMQVIAVQERHGRDLMRMPDVVATATGVDVDGEVVIQVYTAKEVPAAKLPAQLEGVRVVQEVSGPIRALKGGPAPSVSHKAKQTPPIQLGTSGGWGLDLANGYCCGGTLGALVTKDGVQYILSNYHVFESDIVAGGNNLVAQTVDPILQPGLIDVGCNAATAQVVARLERHSALPGGNVDAAIAQVVPGMVRADGAILEIGTVSSQTMEALILQLVKKSGRTTGLTRSKVSGLNAMVSVTYDNECGGGQAFTQTFNHQILVSNRRSGFLAAGDSGSLLVEDVATKPRALGLLFAGSSTIAVANPIDEVLTFFGATMVGN
jgi:hypothetical protein